MISEGEALAELFSEIGDKLGIKHTSWGGEEVGCGLADFDTIFPLTAEKEQRLVLTTSAVWCADHVVQDYQKTHPGFDSRNESMHHMHFTTMIPQGSTWGQVWRLVDKLAERSTDRHHRRVEGFDLGKKGNISLNLGS